MLIAQLFLGLWTGLVSAPATATAEATILATVEQGESALLTLVEIHDPDAPHAGTVVVLSGAAAANWNASFEGKALTTQSLTTTIHDPSNPDEPWVVTTYRRSGESMAAFIRRHRDMVDAVRDVLLG